MQESINTWGSIAKEFDDVIKDAQEESAKQGRSLQISFDPIIDKKIDGHVQYTARPLIIYAVDFFSPQKVSLAGPDIQILLSDKDGFQEVLRNLPRGPLDVIIHSPGGVLEAAESIISMLRTSFTDIRFIVPNAAKSAATMMVLSGDEILMTGSAELGPIDPQFNFQRADGTAVVSPAQAIIDQFENAEKELSKNPSKLPAWVPILPMYGPSLYQDCKNALKLAKDVVRTWLIDYMFKSLPKKGSRVNRARKVVNYFANHKAFKSHSRRIGITEINKNLGDVLKLKKIDDDPILYNRVMGIYLALTVLFQRTPVYKIFWNSNHDKLLRFSQGFQIPLQFPIQRPLQPPPTAPPTTVPPREN